MKKALSIIISIFVFLLIYFLQSNLFNWFTIGGVMPNLFVILVLFLGLFAGRRVGISLGIIFGIIIDILGSQKIGISAIMLAIIGFLGGYFDKNFSKESRITIMIMGAGATFIFEIGVYLINCVILEIPIEMIEFFKIVLVEVLYNTLLTIILYPILQKLGYELEENFKSSQILTRYF